MVEIKINIERKHLFIIVGVMILLAGGIVYAAIDKTDAWHSGSQLEVDFDSDGDGIKETWTVQQAFNKVYWDQSCPGTKVMTGIDTNGKIICSPVDTSSKPVCVKIYGQDGSSKWFKACTDGTSNSNVADISNVGYLEVWTK